MDEFFIFESGNNMAQNLEEMEYQLANFYAQEAIKKEEEEAKKRLAKTRNEGKNTNDGNQQSCSTSGTFDGAKLKKDLPSKQISLKKEQVRVNVKEEEEEDKSLNDFLHYWNKITFEFCDSDCKHCSENIENMKLEYKLQLEFYGLTQSGNSSSDEDDWF